MSGRTYVVHVGRIKLEYHEANVLASKILEDANFKPADDYILESVHGENGPAVRDYQAGDTVDLSAADSNHFRAVPRGGGRA